MKNMSNLKFLTLCPFVDKKKSLEWWLILLFESQRSQEQDWEEKQKEVDTLQGDFIHDKARPDETSLPVIRECLSLYSMNMY